MQQITRSAGGTLTLLNYDADGALADVDGVNGATVRVYDSAGVEIAGSPITGTRTAAGTYNATVPTTLTVLDVYDATWTWPSTASRQSQFEVLGRFLFELAELRAFDAELNDAVKYPASRIREHREIVTERFHEVAEVSFVPRGARDRLDGTETDRIMLDAVEVAKVVAAKVDGVALTSGQLAELDVYPFGLLVWDGGAWTSGIQNVEVLYEHGFLTPPRPVHRVAMKYAKHLLVSSAIEQNERATGVATDAGFFRLTLAGRDGPTGLPEVDAVLAQFGHRKAGGFA